MHQRHSRYDSILRRTGTSDGTFNGSTTGAAFYGDTYPYSETVYEPSPLNRVKNQHGPGAAWRNLSGMKGKVTIDYTTNSVSDANLKCPNYFAIDNNNFNKTGDYAAGQLYVTKMTDEDGNISCEFRSA